MKKSFYAVIVFNLMLSAVFLSADELQNLLSSSGFSVGEKAELISQYNSAVKEDLQKSIISEVIAEGCAKKVSFENLMSEVKRKKEQLRSVKEFCKNTAKTGIVVRDDEKSVKKLIFALDNGFSLADAFDYHRRLKKHKINSYQYLELLRRAALYHKKGVRKDYTIEVLESVFDMGKNYGYAKRVLRLFDGADKDSAEQLKNFIIQGVKENRNVYELEGDAKNRFDYGKKEKNLQRESRRDEIREKERKNRLENAADGKKMRTGK